MSIRNLEFLFRLKSIAVIGASDRPGSVGATVIRNVLAGFTVQEMVRRPRAYATIVGAALPGPAFR